MYIFFCSLYPCFAQHIKSMLTIFIVKFCFESFSLLNFECVDFFCLACWKGIVRSCVHGSLERYTCRRQDDRVRVGEDRFYD